MTVMITNMSRWTRVVRATVVAVGIWFVPEQLNAQDPPSPILVVIDKDSVEFGLQQYQVPPDALNDLIAAVGVRDPVPFFAANVGQLFLLRTGVNGSDSWFAFRRAPILWESAAGADDALENFLLAGPGLGSPDASGERTSLLSRIEDVVPVRPKGAALLVGRSVCAVVYDQDLALSEGDWRIDLDGPTVGIVAFRVANVINDVTWPTLLVQSLDVRSTCSENLATLPE